MNLFKSTFEEILNLRKQANDHSRYLEFIDGEALVNSFPPYTDDKGITHVHVLDLDIEYELVNGEWKERAVF